VKTGRIISIRNVTKSFGPVKAWNDVNFDIRRAILLAAGPSGCGNHLSACCRLRAADSGDLLIDGQQMRRPLCRPTNMVFQNTRSFRI